MLKVLMVGIGVMVAGPAWAGCYNYVEEGSKNAPRAEICLHGQCELTAVEYECGNATSALVGYQNGWSLIYRIEGDDVSATVAKDDRLFTRLEDVTCRDIDAGACRFPD